jgi:hypothetical protein
MDCAQDCLSCICKFSKEANNVRCTCGVEARRGFVEVEKQLRLACEFNADSKTLALFLVETRACHSNDSSGDAFHLKQIDDRLDIVILLLKRGLFRLS